MLRVMTSGGRGGGLLNPYQAYLWAHADPPPVSTLRRMKLTLQAVEQHSARQVIGHALAPLAQHLLASQLLAALAVQALLVVAASRWAQAISRVRPEMHSPTLLGLQGMLLQQVPPHAC